MSQLTLLLCFLITSMMIISSSTSTDSIPNYLNSLCSNTTMFDTNSRYETNLNTIFRYLSSNATNPSGFHQVLAGNGTNDVVYGQFLCRGDQTPSSCNNCVTTAITTGLPNNCPNRKVAVICYDECMVRYSNESCFGTLDQTTVILTLMSTQTVTGNVSQFMDLMGNMMINMVTRVANGSSNKKYATNYVPYTSFFGIYGMEQCTPDLSASDCKQCLVTSIEALPISRGARIIHPSCNVRYESYLFFNGASNLELRPPPLPPRLPTHSGGKIRTSTKLIAIVVPVAVVSLALIAVITFYFITRKSKEDDVAAVETSEDFTTLESLQYDLATLQTATDNFSVENKLGEGGFGSVYKGTLPNGEYVAVKRLSKSSGQGAQEFKNELLLVAKLQHRNLARLLGFCLAGNEKMLIYEYAPNRSLDNFIFDPSKQEQLNWGMRYNIIHGIARGMLYLHQDSSLRVIHRDLKASNILLDANMNPKISDFGMARLFGGDQSNRNTSKVVGTFGYMAPEYVMHGQFSTKSDLYSFGVLVLEIISGWRNSSFHESGFAEDLLSYAWKLGQEGTPLLLVDPTIRNSCSNNEVVRCVNIGLLCVQEKVEARPTTETVVLSLDSYSITLPVPRQPPYFGKTARD